MAWIRDQRCLICAARWKRTVVVAGHPFFFEVEAAHTKVLGHPGLGGGKAPDESCVPLCGWDHREAPDSYHRFGTEQLWAEHHGIDLAAIVQAFRNRWREQGNGGSGNSGENNTQEKAGVSPGP